MLTAITPDGVTYIVQEQCDNAFPCVWMKFWQPCLHIRILVGCLYDWISHSHDDLVLHLINGYIFRDKLTGSSSSHGLISSQHSRARRYHLLSCSTALVCSLCTTTRGTRCLKITNRADQYHVPLKFTESRPEYRDSCLENGNGRDITCSCRKNVMRLDYVGVPRWSMDLALALHCMGFSSTPLYENRVRICMSRDV